MVVINIRFCIDDIKPQATIKSHIFFIQSIATFYIIKGSFFRSKKQLLGCTSTLMFSDPSLSSYCQELKATFLILISSLLNCFSANFYTLLKVSSSSNNAIDV